MENTTKNIQPKLSCEEAQAIAVEKHQVTKREDLLKFFLSIFSYDMTAAYPIVVDKKKLSIIIASGNCVDDCIVFTASTTKSNTTLRHQKFSSSDRLDKSGTSFINTASADEIQSTYSIALLKYIYSNMSDESALSLLRANTGINKKRLHLLSELGILNGAFNFCDEGPLMLPPVFELLNFSLKEL